jgi:hypothetical protein
MPEITKESAEVATSSMPGFRIVVAERYVIGRRFMLEVAEPATPRPRDVADRQALRDALEDRGPRIPYNQLRRDLGLT